MTFEWTPSIVEYLCDELIGGKSIHELAGTNGLPSEMTIYREMARNEEFQKSITHARLAQQEFIADECVRLSDTAKVEDWQVVRLRIWARQWRAGKLSPKKYGDATTLKHANPDGETLVFTMSGAHLIEPTEPDEPKTD